jgi:hypothetical protein
MKVFMMQLAKDIFATRTKSRPDEEYLKSTVSPESADWAAIRAQLYPYPISLKRFWLA